MINRATLLLITLVLTGACLFAAVPRQITYQGRLTSSGAPVANGTYQLTFSIYGVPSGGTALWTSGQQPVQVTNGQFTVQLGATATLPASIFADSARWLGTKLGSNAEMTPRTKIATAAYAYHAQQADTAQVALSAPAGNGGWSDDGATVRLTTVTDNVGIGTTTPKKRLDVAGSALVRDTLGIGASPTGGDLRVYRDSSMTGFFVDGNYVSGGTPTYGTRVYIIGSGKTVEFHLDQSGDTTVMFPNNAINSAEILDGSILSTDIQDLTLTDADLSLGAAIAPSKISGTAATLSATQTFTGANTFQGSEVLSTGIYSGFKFRDRGQVAADNWSLYSFENKARLWRQGFGDVITFNATGSMALGTGTPDSGKVHIMHTGASPGAGLFVQSSSASYALKASYTNTTFSGYGIKAYAAKGYGLWAECSNGTAIVANGGVTVMNGALITPVLTLNGGADLAEKFDVGRCSETRSPIPGMAVVIDPDNPGRLLVSCVPYDRKVAGVISGAGDVATGMTMSHEGSLADGETPVALTGRVYCWADATDGAITPGDLLTTSSTPGHVMKVTDFARAQGACIGKAMTALRDGRGLVLVLVNLQ